MPKRFDTSFKSAAVQKALSRDNQQTLESIALELGIGHSTLQRWISEHSHTTPIDGQPGNIEKRPQDWNQAERFHAILQANQLSSDEEINEFCRKIGVYSYHLTQWQSEFMSDKNNKQILQDIRAEKKQLQAENKQLKRELNRKEKALAEAAALLILEKKTQALYRELEDDLPNKMKGKG